MPARRFPRAVCFGQGLWRGPRGSVHGLSAQGDADADGYDDEPEPFGNEFFDPDALDDDEPEPEPGDFWPQIDDD